MLAVGIDVKIRKRARLPIAVLHPGTHGPEPLALRRMTLPPQGSGNAQVLDRAWRVAFAEGVAAWLAALEARTGGRIAAIAIDAPMHPAADGAMRACEQALSAHGISFFRTPDEREIAAMIGCAKAHLDAGHALAKLPNANRLWMLAGFELFHTLGKRWPCLEIYPQAIAWALGAGPGAKTIAVGFAAQLAAFARALGRSPAEIATWLKDSGFGSGHDRLDALTAAWVASLGEDARIALGRAPDDAIWIPRPNGGALAAASAGRL